MAFTTQVLKDTYNTSVIKIINTGTQQSNATLFDASNTACAITEITLDQTPSTNFKIGETVTFGGSGSGTAIVQDFFYGGTKLWVIPDSDLTAFSISANSSITGSESSASAFSTTSLITRKDTAISHVAWVSDSSSNNIQLKFKGSSADSIGLLLTGSGRLHLATQHEGASIINDAVNTTSGGDTVGDILINDSAAINYTLILTVRKVSGYGAPRLDKNTSLGY